MLRLLSILLLALAGFALWVRLAPVDSARWHVDPALAPDPGPGGFRVTLQLPEPPVQALERLDRLILTTKGTTKIAGSIEEGRLTYESRSRIWGFPDYTTVSATKTTRGSEVAILGRLRFGKGDLGVNRRRIESWTKNIIGVAQ